MGWTSKVIRVCAWCKKSQDPADPNLWRHAGATAADAETVRTHGICPACHREVLSLADAARSSSRSQ